MPGSPSPPPRPTLTRYTIAVETTAQAQAVQTLLWWLWLAALSTSARQTTLTDPDAGSYSYEYNGVGEQVKQTDARGYTTRTTYDAFGRKQFRYETQGSGSGDATTAWVYGGDADGCTNAKGLLCSVAYGGPNTASTSKSTAYDQYSRPTLTTTTIDGKTFASAVAYDALGRPLYSVYPQATPQTAPLALQHFYSGAGYASVNKSSLPL